MKVEFEKWLASPLNIQKSKEIKDLDSKIFSGQNTELYFTISFIVIRKCGIAKRNIWMNSTATPSGMAGLKHKDGRMENLDPEKPLDTPFFDSSLNDPIRSKTSLRMNYEAQVEVIKKQIGDLEKIRENLGLSARKICQLLLVDPSSWTRWTKKGDTPPPHIYRALQWYLTLQEKIPGLTPTYFLGGSRAPQDEEWNRRFEEQKMIFETQRSLDQKEHLFELDRLNKKMTRLYGFMLLSWGIGALLLYTLH